MTGDDEEEGNALPPFLTKLYELVDSPDATHIEWGDDGSSFRLLDATLYARELLPLYFKHNSLASFTRQLLTYGFKRCLPPPGSAGTLEFYHEHFRRGDRAALRLIRRRVASRKRGTPCGPYEHHLGAHSLPVVMTPDDAVLIQVERLREHVCAVEMQFQGSMAEIRAVLEQLERQAYRCAHVDGNRGAMLASHMGPMGVGGMRMQFTGGAPGPPMHGDAAHQAAFAAHVQQAAAAQQQQQQLHHHHHHQHQQQLQLQQLHTHAQHHHALAYAQAQQQQHAMQHAQLHAAHEQAASSLGHLARRADEADVGYAQPYELPVVTPASAGDACRAQPPPARDATIGSPGAQVFDHHAHAVFGSFVAGSGPSQDSDKLHGGGAHLSLHMAPHEHLQRDGEQRVLLAPLAAQAQMQHEGERI
ncbi:hypothetical protein KFE25_012334 [Diacronema lutheri]|uniref:HSF-type DNA-binding domain-containing protein n=1 Tax=Diacronema lutheri TaxID=2081491 RepID=A0A8J5XGV4_DIALT|nr:hypothetical protein KFE25_012334 [Diacronema lutheri]